MLIVGHCTEVSGARFTIFYGMMGLLVLTHSMQKTLGMCEEYFAMKIEHRLSFLNTFPRDAKLMKEQRWVF